MILFLLALETLLLMVLRVVGDCVVDCPTNRQEFLCASPHLLSLELELAIKDAIREKLAF